MPRRAKGLFAGDSFLCSLDDMCGVQAIGGHQLGGSTALAELIPTVDKLHGSRSTGDHHGSDSLAEAAECVVLLGNHGGTGLGYGSREGGGVERLDGGDVQHFCADAFGLEGFGSLKGLPDGMAGCHDGNIGTGIEIVDLADFSSGLVKLGTEGRPNLR